MTVLAFAAMSFAVANAQDKKDAKKDAPAAATPAQGKLPPQAKTQPEFDAYKVAAAATDPFATFLPPTAIQAGEPKRVPAHDPFASFVPDSQPYGRHDT